MKSQAFEALRDAIFSGQFSPGDALREAHLAKDLQVSQVTVREALIQLEHVGLVVRVPNKGTTVTKLTKKEVMERLSIRSRLEEMAWLESSRCMEEVHYAELQQHLDDMAAAASDNDYFEAAQRDLQFHRSIWEQSDNKTLYQMLNQLMIPLLAFVSMKRRSEQEDLIDLVKKHENILAQLKSRDEAVIKQTLRDHLELMKVLPESIL